MSEVSRERNGMTVKLWMIGDMGAHEELLREEELPISDEDRARLQQWYELSQDEERESEVENMEDEIIAIVEKVTGDDEWSDKGLLDDVMDILDKT